MELCIGEVIAVKGIKIIIKVYDQSNLETIFYKGKSYQGVSINEHLCIQRGFKDIIAKVEGEYLDESRAETENHTVSYIRKVELQDRKSTRLNSSHVRISYAVFCLK